MPTQGDDLIFVPDGWVGIVERLDQAIRDIEPTSRFVQIDQMGGRLRIYVDPYSIRPTNWKAVSDLVRSAEEESRRTCDVCAKAAHFVVPGDFDWKFRTFVLGTRCVEHGRL